MKSSNAKRFDRPDWPALQITAFGLLVVFIIVVTGISLFPSTAPPSSGYLDKVSHMLAHGVLAALLLLSAPRLKLWQVLLIGTAYGLFVEAAQGLMGWGRTASFWDVMANLSGTVLVLGGWIGLCRLSGRR